MAEYGTKVNLRTRHKDFGGEGHSGKYDQETLADAETTSPFLMDDEEQEERLVPPKLNEISAEDLERLDRDGMGILYTPAPAEAEKLEMMFKRAWDLFHDIISDENGKPRLTFFYCWDEGKSADLYSTSDGMSNWWSDHAGLGIGKSALEQGEEYLQFLFVHEICHIAFMSSKHESDFENYLNYMLQKYNSRYGTNLQNDYSDFKGTFEQRADSRDLKPAYRIDHASFTPEALAALEAMEKKTPGHTTQKKATPGSMAKKVRKDGMKAATKRRRGTPASTPEAPTARSRMIRQMQNSTPANSETGARKMVKNGAGRVAGAHSETA